MGLMRNFFRAYPSQTVLMLLALLLSGLAEGIGLSALLPAIHLRSHQVFQISMVFE